jgi:hypothetical protein
MQRIRGWLTVVLLSVVTLPTLATAQHLMEDPLFGITYDTHEVNFHPIPQLLQTHCSYLKAHYVRGWIYGHFKTDDSEYFLVSGLMAYHGGSNVTSNIAPDESGGLAVALREQKCLVDQADYFLTQRANPAARTATITASRPVLDGILKDAFERYVKAFGGRENFLKRVTPEAIGPQIVLEELKVFEGKSNDSHRHQPLK